VEACDDDKQCIINVNETQENGSIVVERKGQWRRNTFFHAIEDIRSQFYDQVFRHWAWACNVQIHCRQAQGKIWFETKPGEGTTFHIEFRFAN
jgi:light-regulated signal transduction histidine kinase (bacteriophytochrome)